MRGGATIQPVVRTRESVAVPDRSPLNWTRIPVIRHPGLLHSTGRCTAMKMGRNCRSRRKAVSIGLLGRANPLLGTPPSLTPLDAYARLRPPFLAPSRDDRKDDTEDGRAPPDLRRSSRDSAPAWLPAGQRVAIPRLADPNAALPSSGPRDLLPALPADATAGGRGPAVRRFRVSPQRRGRAASGDPGAARGIGAGGRRRGWGVLPRALRSAARSRRQRQDRRGTHRRVALLHHRDRRPQGRRPRA